jgi:hypothetical protein
MQNFSKCSCGNNFFIEHENATIVIDNKVYNILASSSPTGYKIIECVFCRRQYLAQQKAKGQMSEVVSLNAVEASDIQKLKERLDKFSSEKFGSEILQHILRKS